ncbi:hypothetical protein DFH11DRAFT_1808221 [Phellopilus nigrolimitatus]|nr:hypothetical protein DFH11DRAFT_1808221 [Phellopilus nigrolimitatus]
MYASASSWRQALHVALLWKGNIKNIQDGPVLMDRYGVMEVKIECRQSGSQVNRRSRLKGRIRIIVAGARRATDIGLDSAGRSRSKDCDERAADQSGYVQNIRREGHRERSTSMRETVLDPNSKEQRWSSDLGSGSERVGKEEEIRVHLRIPHSGNCGQLIVAVSKHKRLGMAMISGQRLRSTKFLSSPTLSTASSHRHH